MAYNNWRYSALEMMKADPAILEVKRDADGTKQSLFRVSDNTIGARTEAGGFTWTDIAHTKVTLERSSAVYNITEEELEAERLATEVAESALRIKTPPHSPEEDEHDYFSTPSPCVRRATSPPPLERKGCGAAAYLPPPPWPLVRACCSTGTACTDFECLGSPTPNPALAPLPAPKHLFFDEEGNVVSREEFEAAQAAAQAAETAEERERAFQEEEERLAQMWREQEEQARLDENGPPCEDAEEEEGYEWGVQIPRIRERMVARHPRVILAFFRFIEALNECAFEDEKVTVKPMPCDVFTHVMEFVEKNPPPPEFEGEVRDLKHYLLHNLLG